jgi:hypothetical protein
MPVTHLAITKLDVLASVGDIGFGRESVLAGAELG